MLNPIITHSPRLAAMATNKPFGDEAVRNPAILHRMAFIQMKRRGESPTVEIHSPAESLREQTA